VVGKFLAVLFLLVLVTVLSLPIPLSLARLGAFDAGQIVAQYVGVLLIGAAGIAVGLFISSLATNQVTAFVLGALALVAITLMGQLPRALSLSGWLADVLAYLALSQHYDSFRKGLLDSRDVLYFALICALFLFLNLRVLLRRKS
ncbi:MAG TPA: ABC transporter permease, partial [Spirochaetia bacterium]|nr:ABC transporter permease [Spirochaetia bacterium]